MTPRELVAVWRTRADGYVGGEWGPAIASTYRGCATELEEVLAEAGWLPAEAVVGLMHPQHRLGGSVYVIGHDTAGGIWIVYRDNDTGKLLAKPFDPPYARRVPPPPGESDA